DYRSESHEQPQLFRFHRRKHITQALGFRFDGSEESLRIQPGNQLWLIRARPMQNSGDYAELLLSLSDSALDGFAVCDIRSHITAPDARSVEPLKVGCQSLVARRLRAAEQGQGSAALLRQGECAFSSNTFASASDQQDIFTTDGQLSICSFGIECGFMQFQS